MNSAQQREARPDRNMPTIHFDAPTLDSIEPKAVEWWWPGYLPKGKVVILEGDPSLGKSQISIDIAARLSRGGPFPGERGRTAPTNVVLVTFEDGVEDTMLPRLIAAGADLQRVSALRTIAYDDGMPHLWRLPEDVPALEHLVRERGAGLVVVDTLGSAMASNRTQSKATDPAYEALAHLARMCEDTGCTVLVIRHFTKSTAGNAVSQGGGSMGVIGMARVCLAVHRDPDVEVPPERPELDVHRVLTVVKNNLAPKAITRTFQVMSGANGAPCISWRGISTRTADGLIDARRNAADPKHRSKLDEARDFLRDALANGAALATTVTADAKNAGITPSTLKLAKDALGVIAEKARGPKAPWVWRLPSSSKETTEEGGQILSPLSPLSPLTRLQDLPSDAEILVALDDGTEIRTSAGDPDIHTFADRITRVDALPEAA